MTQNLNTADRIVKLLLSGGTILLYALDIIKGRGAIALVIGSSLLIAISVTKKVIEQSKRK